MVQRLHCDMISTEAKSLATADDTSESGSRRKRTNDEMKQKREDNMKKTTRKRQELKEGRAALLSCD